METKFAKMNDSVLNGKYKDPSWWTGVLNFDEFDIHEKVAWMQKNWTLSIYASVLYLLLIVLGQQVMKPRKAFNLKIPLAIWNLTLGAFSIKACTILLPEFVQTLSTKGLYVSICGTVDIVSKTSLYWGYLFVLSKMVELGDTAFIILRKRKLIFLHWYHHISVLVCVWLSSKNLMSTGAWFAMANFTVHAMMYTYFGLITFGVKVPRYVPMVITTFQISQMFVGVSVNGYALRVKLAGNECAVLDFHIWLIFGMYLSYLVLFGNFFYKNYLCSSNREGKEKKIK